MNATRSFSSGLSDAQRSNGAPNCKWRTGAGFTLIELAIVLFCVALLLVGLLGPLRTQLEARDRQRAQEELGEIKAAVLGFAVSQARLPCPDCSDNAGPCAGAAANDGLEDLNGGQCRTNWGNVPYSTLAVATQDPWGNPYRLRIRTEGGVNFSDLGAAGPALPNCPIAPARASFNLCDDGNINVFASAAAIGGAPDVASNVPALIISYGQNQNAAQLAVNNNLSAEELANIDGDLNFVDRNFSRDDALEFDDLLVWIPTNVLRAQMVNAGLLP